MSGWARYFSPEEIDGRKPIADRDLSGCDLSGAELDGAQFFRCNLDGVDASRASFGKSSFIEVTLRLANLTGAMLRGADFVRSNLSHARLVSADLRRRARFDTCDLRDAHFDDAQLGDTELVRCTFDGIEGSPREPYDVTVDDASLLDIWRRQRRPDPGRAPFELGERLPSDGPARTLVVEIVDIRSELDAIFGAREPVFPVLVPWFTRVRIQGVLASAAVPPRVIYVARMPDGSIELLEGSIDALNRAAVAEPVRIANAADALAYARFGEYVTSGAAIAPERTEETRDGWVIRALSKAIAVGRNGTFRR